MPSFIAESEDAVIAAIRAGVVPDEVLYAPAHVAREAQTLRIGPTGPVPDAARLELERLGFRTEESSVEGRLVDSWPQIVEPRRGREPLPSLGLVLFVARRERFADLIGTLLRLGADRQEVAFFQSDQGELCATKVVDPPYYVMLSAAEGGEVRGYRPVEGNERAWIELGYDHPLASHFVVPEGELLVIGGSQWTRIQDGPWRSIYTHLELSTPGTTALASIESDVRLQVVLRLVPATPRTPPTLWVLRDENALDALVRSMPDSALRAFAFARLKPTSGDEPRIVIRARIAHEAPPLELPDAVAYVALQHTDNLFVPRGFAIHPPLRRERLVDNLASDADALVWLVPIDDEGGFRVERAPADAFAPLAEWVDHVAAEDAIALAPWLEGAIFELDDFVGVEAAAPVPRTTAARSTPTPKKDPLPAPSQAPRTAEDAPSREHREAALEVHATAPSALEREIGEVETRLLELLLTNSDVERTASDWRLLGALYADVGRTSEAALAFSHALWGLEPDDSQWRPILRRWAQSEEGTPRFDADQVRGDLVRALHALARSEAIDVAALRTMLDAHADSISTRAAWLLDEALARHTGDELGFVRAQDHMRVRLRGGLRIADDVAGFVRRHGQDMSGHASAELARALDEALATYRASPRQRSEAEAPAALTDGYVCWLFAWGFAHLGENARSLELSIAADEAHAGADDDVHAYLRAAFRARLEHARTGRGLQVPLPFELHQRLESLPRMDRYKVDRLREASLVLEGGDVDAFGAFRDESAPVEIEDARALPELVDAAIEEGNLRRAGALLQLLAPYDAVPRLEAFTSAISTRPASEQVGLLDDALLVLTTTRNHVHRRTAVDALLQIVAGADVATARHAARVLSRHASRIQHWGRDRAAATVHGRLAEVSNDALAHLELATLLAALGNANELALAAQKAVTIERPRDWLAWHRQHSLALARISSAHAIEGTRIALPRLERVTDSFQTNSHFCLSVLHFMESMVLGLARADLAVSDEARRIIDADEQHVRRRIFGRSPFTTEKK